MAYGKKKPTGDEVDAARQKHRRHSLKNKKGVTVYKLNQNGKLTAIAKNKTVSKNGVILLTSIKST